MGTIPSNGMHWKIHIEWMWYMHGISTHPFNPHMDMRGLCGPQNTLIVAPAVIFYTRSYRFWSPLAHIQKCEFFCKSVLGLMIFSWECMTTAWHPSRPFSWFSPGFRQMKKTRLTYVFSKVHFVVVVIPKDGLSGLVSAKLPLGHGPPDIILLKNAFHFFNFLGPKCFIIQSPWGVLAAQLTITTNILGPVFV